MGDSLMQLRRQVRLRHRYLKVRWLFGRFFEFLRYAPVRPDESLRFHVVSASRNAGDAALSCLRSVYDQAWPRDQVRHVFIDDASTDDTDAKVRDWLERHPDHNVEYIHQTVRQGGAANNMLGFEKGAPGSIVAELNGDDWLPDPGVLPFLARVYAAAHVWKTYNTHLYLGARLPFSRPVPPEVVRAKTYRDVAWFSSALHTFRRELLDHVDPDTLIDPQTGRYWENADDQALYLAMLELAGTHAHHVYRVTYVYNFRETSEHNVDRTGQEDRNERIRQLPRHRLLERL